MKSEAIIRTMSLLGSQMRKLYPTFQHSSMRFFDAYTIAAWRKVERTVHSRALHHQAQKGTEMGKIAKKPKVAKTKKAEPTTRVAIP
jgi:hypothetical protein